MKLINQLGLSRPEESKFDTKFTESVMNIITAKKSSRSIVSRLAMRPVMAVALALIVTVLISGVGYAVLKYLWSEPQINVTNSVSVDSGHQQFLVESDSCGSEDLTRKYKVKQGFSMTNEELELVAKADCEYSEAIEWAVNSFKQKEHDITDAFTPGRTYTMTRNSPGIVAEIQQIDGSSVTLSHGSTHDIAPSTIIVIDRQESTPDSLKAGDTVSMFEQISETLHNPETCTPTHCSPDRVARSNKTLAIIKFNFSLSDYEKTSQLMRISPCIGNENDMCNDGAGSVEVYTKKFEINSSPDDFSSIALIEGRVREIVDSLIVLETSSGREVSVTTDFNLVETFHQSEVSRLNNLTISVGDSLVVRYRPTSQQQQSIDIKDIYEIGLLLEIANKDDTPQKY